MHEETIGPSATNLSTDSSARRVRASTFWLPFAFVGFILLMPGLVIPASVAADDSAIAIIVSASWTGDADIDTRTLRRIFLGRIQMISGKTVHPISRPSGSPLREAFNAKVLRKSERKLAAYWIQQALSGGARQPTDLETFREVVAFVASDPRAIAYVELKRMKAEAPSSVRIVREIR